MLYCKLYSSVILRLCALSSYTFNWLNDQFLNHVNWVVHINNDWKLIQVFSKLKVKYCWYKFCLYILVHLMVVFCRFTLLAPDLLRTDSQENIYLEANGVSTPITVSISIQDFRKSTQLFRDSVTLNEENGFHTLKAIQVTADSKSEVMPSYQLAVCGCNFI